MTLQDMANDYLAAAALAVMGLASNEIAQAVEHAVALLASPLEIGGKWLAIGTHAEYLQMHAQRDAASPYWPVVVAGGLSDENMIVAHGKPDDALIAYLPAKPTRHEVAAVMRARHMGLRTLLLVGDAPLPCGGDVVLLAGGSMARAAELHLIYTHILLAGLRATLAA